MWNKIGVIALSAGLLMATQSARADDRDWRDSRDWNDGRGSVYASGASRSGDYDYARVLSSEPITRRIRVTEPRRECYEETRYDDQRYDRRDDSDYRAYGGSGNRPAAGPMILGGIIGAAIGNQFGRGDGRRAATVAGALIGSAIGHDRADRRTDRSSAYYGGRDNYDRDRYSDGRPSTVQHCDVRYDESWEDRVEAYLVTYEYNGRRYTTRMNYDPGPRLRVYVAVRPEGR